MTAITFLRENARWVGGGFLLTFFSSFGQTFFIALSAGNIRSEYALSHGEFGTLYMFATLGSALTLPFLGRIVDVISPARVAALVCFCLATACLLMSYATVLPLLFLAIYMLRLFGQGMMTHTAMTAMGKWFAAQRGKAVSFTAIGVNFGEATFPLAFVMLSLAFGWRATWIMAAVAMLFFALPVIFGLLRHEREPLHTDPVSGKAEARNWTRAEVLRDPLFYILLTGVLAPPFIGTTIFFHQVYLVELRGWSQEAFAASFVFMSSMTVLFALVCGALVDRFSAAQILPTFLIPLALACFVLASVEAQWSAFAFMALLGVSYGFSSTLFGALWPEVYGTKYLGAVRATIVAIMVFATAAGPGATGYLIDLGVPYPSQIFVMGLYSLFACIILFYARRIILRRKNA